ncbi:TolC family protein [Chitinophaga silvatica]|uniref:TolC family protein n=1 Tax=Chitinophaga silvatica TaxID=2282649 RepID=A0A3E1YCX3_9BACT|nr:TolC family protein [Chitinophaga silvatica]RFS24051.1 TolC family protein [Chitinophaga silvatica]
MLYTGLANDTAIPNNFWPSIKKKEKVSSQLLYFWNVMSISRIAGLVLVLLFADITSAKAQDKWSLQRCVDYALQNNLQVKQQEIQRRLSELTLKQSKLGMIPSLNGSLGSGFNQGRNPDPETNTLVTQSFWSVDGGLSLGTDIFNWFYRQRTITSNKYDLESNSFLLLKARNDLAFNVATAFLQILLNSEQLKVNQVQVELTQSNLENTKKLVIAGSVPESNQADLEAQLAMDSTNLVTAQNQVVLSILQMKAYLNLGFDIPFEADIPANISSLPVAPLHEMAPEMVYSAALTTYPLTKADESRIQSANYGYKAAKSQLYPKISLSASLGSSYSNSIKELVGGIPKIQVDTIGYVADGANPATPVAHAYPVITSPVYKTLGLNDQLSNYFKQSVRLSLSIPIFNGWQVRTNVAKAKLNVESLELTRDIDNQKLRQDIYTAHANAVAALQKYNASSTGVLAAQKAYDFATKRFNLGLMNTIDYITTQSKLYRAQIEKVSAQYDYIFKMKLLEFYRDQKISL